MESFFERNEIKFVIDNKQYVELTKLFEKTLCHDNYFFSTISSIYFDTEQYDMASKAMGSDIYKEKLRVRSYDNFSKNVFIELKKKFMGITYKRRVILEAKPYKEVFLEIEKSDNQIAKELNIFIKRYNIRPSIMLFYERKSYVGANDLRITIDDKIIYRNYDFENKKIYGKELLKGKYLMEIKTLESIPLWLVQALSELNIYKSSFSKYKNAYLKERMEYGKVI